MNINKTKYYTHPSGATVSLGTLKIFFLTLFLGPLYLIYHGMFMETFFYVVFALITAGFGWLLWPFIAPYMMRRHYMNEGYRPYFGGINV